ncbi:MAG: SGNH/GDSL hydrolase family protein [Clostridiales bacterium]|nr:SGNH/GDSL hydrolase family protein [Clostridiales bacterium]
MAAKAEKESKALTKIITALALVAVSVAILWFAQRLLMPKYQVGIIEGSFTEEYYKEKVPHDVVFFGDCDAYENFSPIKMYQEYGISSYIRGSGEQYICQSYYLLRDVLQTETPKVVVLSIHNLQHDAPHNEAYNRMTLDGMRWSQDKIDAINASMTKDETFASYVFPILRYHDRWSSLTKTDFEHVFSKDITSHNGYYMRCDVKAETLLPPMPLQIDYSFGENAMYYLDQIRILCEEKGIELLLVRAPIEYKWYPQWDENVEKYAAQYGLTYLNLCDYKEEMGLDMSVDTYDGGAHLNLFGAEKNSVFFGQYLIDHYELTDYRTIPAVAAEYEKDIQFYNDMRDDQLYEIDTYGELKSYGPFAVEK